MPNLCSIKQLKHITSALVLLENRLYGRPSWSWVMIKAANEAVRCWDAKNALWEIVLVAGFVRPIPSPYGYTWYILCVLVISKRPAFTCRIDHVQCHVYWIQPV